MPQPINIEWFLSETKNSESKNSENNNMKQKSMETKYIEVYCKSFLPTNRGGMLKRLLLHTTP